MTNVYLNIFSFSFNTWFSTLWFLLTPFYLSETLIKLIEHNYLGHMKFHK